MVVDVAFKLVIDVVWPLTNPNRVVDVGFKLLINNIEPVNNEFILLNIVVNVLFKLLIDNIELIDNEFKFVVVAYIYYSNLLCVLCFILNWLYMTT